MSRIKERMKKDFVEDPQLKEAVDDILFPYKSKKEPTITIEFGVPPEAQDEWREAISFASAHNTYGSKKSGRLTKHRLDLKPDQVWEIYQLYQMLENSPHLEIFIDGKRIPYTATLWLPLLWFYL